MPPGGRAPPQPPPPPRRTTDAYNRSLETSPSPQETLGASCSDTPRRTITRPGYIPHSNGGSRARAQALRAGVRSCPGERDHRRRGPPDHRRRRSRAPARERVEAPGADRHHRPARRRLRRRCARCPAASRTATAVARGAGDEPRRVCDRLPRRGRVSRLRRAPHGGRVRGDVVRAAGADASARRLRGDAARETARRRPPSAASGRLALTIANCWFSVGPALVLYLAGTRGAQWDDLPV